jgi:hypothetical protein
MIFRNFGSIITTARDLDECFRKVDLFHPSIIGMQCNCSTFENMDSGILETYFQYPLKLINHGKIRSIFLPQHLINHGEIGLAIMGLDQQLFLMMEQCLDQQVYAKCFHFCKRSQH